MKPPFRYADVHCHPNLKTFGHSFDKKENPRSDVWHTVKPSFFTKGVYRLSGITKFSQADFTTLAGAGARIAFVSLYPFEKGFFINRRVWPPLAAALANWGIEVGYQRVRYLQQHTDYFADLVQEYRFLTASPNNKKIDGREARWVLTRNWSDVAQVLASDHDIAVVLTIEGAHVFNCGLAAYGVQANEQEVLANIAAVKSWQHVPLFIGLAHNFNNELCGHARSLQRLGNLVNQDEGIDTGLTHLGRKVIAALLDKENGRRILIDLKHMSLLSRQEYYALLQTSYAGDAIPLVVSHGSVNGLTMAGEKRHTTCLDIFNPCDLNFFDEEIIAIAKSNGLFALQMDFAVHTCSKKVKAFLKTFRDDPPVRQAARIVWNQLQYIAELCDSAGLFAWGCTAVGSDFDGSIHPLPGVLTAAGIAPLSEELLLLADRFLAEKTLRQPQNRNITAAEVIDRFVYRNTEDFLQTFYAEE